MYQDTSSEVVYQNWAFKYLYNQGHKDLDAVFVILPKPPH